MYPILRIHCYTGELEKIQCSPEKLDLCKTPKLFAWDRCVKTHIQLCCFINFHAHCNLFIPRPGKLAKHSSFFEPPIILLSFWE